MLPKVSIMVILKFHGKSNTTIKHNYIYVYIYINIYIHTRDHSNGFGKVIMKGPRPFHMLKTC